MRFSFSLDATTVLVERNFLGILERREEKMVDACLTKIAMLVERKIRGCDFSFPPVDASEMNKSRLRHGKNEKWSTFFTRRSTFSTRKKSRIPRVFRFPEQCVDSRLPLWMVSLGLFAWYRAPLDFESTPADSKRPGKSQTNRTAIFRNCSFPYCINKRRLTKKEKIPNTYKIICLGLLCMKLTSYEAFHNLWFRRMFDQGYRAGWMLFLVFGPKCAGFSWFWAASWEFRLRILLAWNLQNPTPFWSENIIFYFLQNNYSCG